MSDNRTYDDYIRRSILLNNEFGISHVGEFEHLKSMILARDEYPNLVSLIKNKEIEKIKNIPPPTVKTYEYISILQFTDQNGDKFIVTTFDSDDIAQDPQVIDIFKL